MIADIVEESTMNSRKDLKLALLSHRSGNILTRQAKTNKDEIGLYFVYLKLQDQVNEATKKDKHVG